MSLIDEIGCHAPVEDVIKFARQVNLTLAYFQARIELAPWWDKSRLKRAMSQYERDFYRINDYLMKRIPDLTPLGSYVKYGKDGTISYHDAEMRPIDPENEEQLRELGAARDRAHRKYIAELIGPRPNWDELDEEFKQALEKTDGKVEMTFSYKHEHVEGFGDLRITEQTSGD
jgi:hypothetical protein